MGEGDLISSKSKKIRVRCEMQDEKIFSDKLG